MKRRNLLVAAAVFILTLNLSVAFAEEAKAPARAWPESIDQSVAEVKKSINTITMEEFKVVVDKKGDVVIIDVREPEEYKTGYVPGAINIPRGLAEFVIWKKVAGYPDKTDTGKKIYVYCKLGGRGFFTAKALKDAGFTNVTAVAMKVEDWVKAGYPLER
jgi:rhodanese-related sulfurtransferase